MPLAAKPRRLTWLLLTLTSTLLLASYRLPAELFQTSPTATAAATGSARAGTTIPTVTSTPLRPDITGTPRPTGLAGPSPTPEIPPAEEIGSTDGIIGWGVIMVAIIFAVLLWHRPDWARRSPAR